MNYLLLWEQQDKNAYINFPQVLTETQLLPFIISNRNKHVHYRDLTSFNTNHFELINYEYHFIVEHSETSDKRRYSISNIISETSLEEYNPSILRHDTGQSNSQFNRDDHTELFQNQEPQQLKIVLDQQQDTTTIQNVLDPSKTATIQNVSELSDITVNSRQSFTITNDSNMLQKPVQKITENTISDQNQNDTTQNTNQDNISTLSTSKTHITQPFRTQQPSPRNYDPTSTQSQYSTQTTPHNSPQQSFSNTHGTNAPRFQPTVQFQTTTPTSNQFYKAWLILPLKIPKHKIYKLV